MLFRVTRLDIVKARESWPNGEFAPAVIFARDARENHVWHVVDQPANLTTQQDISWAVASGDEYIRIPLFLYDAPAQGDLSLAFMFQLGLICGNLDGRVIKIAHIVTGNPAELTYNPDGSVSKLSVWMGLAFVF
jgi:hypothetical protein